MTLTIGTTVAATDVQSDLMRHILGVTPHYGRAAIIGVLPEIPEDIREQALSSGARPDSFEGFEAYVIEPQNVDGSPVEELEDVAFVALRHPDYQPLAYVREIGNLPTVVHFTELVKSQFLATVEATNSTLVDQFRTELEDDLNQLAVEQDDEADPGFVD